MPAAPFPVSPQSNYVSQIFAKKLLARFLANTVLEKVTNTDYQGEISGQGSKVIIRKDPDVGISNYTGTVSYGELGDSAVEMSIDKAKSYAFKDDDIFNAQRDIKNFIASATTMAARNMAIEVERDLFGNVYAQAGLQFNNGTANTPVTIDKTTVLDLIVDLNTKFDENNIMGEGRFIILPAWAIGMLKKSDLKQAQITGDATGVVRTGVVGEVDGTTIYSSNLLTTADGGVHALAGTKQAISFASQFVNNEQLRLQDTFATAYRGLKVYGYKVVQPTALIDVLIKK
jgi:hypothetical protein